MTHFCAHFLEWLEEEGKKIIYSTKVTLLSKFSLLFEPRLWLQRRGIRVKFAIAKQLMPGKSSGREMAAVEKHPGKRKKKRTVKKIFFSSEF